MCLWAAAALRPGSKVWTTDVCVPLSRMAECIAETQADIERSGLIAPVVGHVGDGNFHVFIVVDDKNPDEMERAKQLNDRMVLRAIDMGGTCTGEHGVGVGKVVSNAAAGGLCWLDLACGIHRRVCVRRSTLSASWARRTWS